MAESGAMGNWDWTCRPAVYGEYCGRRVHYGRNSFERFYSVTSFLGHIPDLIIFAWNNTYSTRHDLESKEAWGRRSTMGRGNKTAFIQGISTSGLFFLFPFAHIRGYILVVLWYLVHLCLSPQ